MDNITAIEILKLDGWACRPIRIGTSRKMRESLVILMQHVHGLLSVKQSLGLREEAQ